MPSPITPPTTPPAIAPVWDDLPEDIVAVGEAEAEDEVEDGVEDVDDVDDVGVVGVVPATVPVGWTEPVDSGALASRSAAPTLKSSPILTSKYAQPGTAVPEGIFSG